jgi:hypothetical protein
MKTNGKSMKPRRNEANGFLKKFVTLWVLTAFILSNAPAHANRQDRLDTPRPDRQERRAERMAERSLQRALLPTVTAPLAPAKLTPVFQNNIRLNMLEQRRMERANLVTTRNEARQAALQEKLSSRHQLNNHTVQTLESGRTRNINARLNLDLSSVQNNITLGEKLFANSDSKSVSVTVGGEERTYAAGSKVTAAEYASILQVLNGGQTLTLDERGRASGGKLDFETITSNGDNLKLSSLVIPEQVLAVGNFSRTSEVTLKGDLVNYGSVYAVSNRDGGSKATIATTNLHNQSGGLISSVPNSSLGTDLSTSVDLKLRADDTLANAGKIESSGDLTLSAGNQLINGDERGRPETSSASATAQNNLFIEAPVVSNSGLLAAQSGSVNLNGTLDATHDGSITVNNANGTIQALNGNINFRDPSAVGAAYGKPSTVLQGGDLLSQKLNIFGGDGAVDVKANTITGGVTVKSGTAKVSALESSLILDDVTTTGDPTFTSGTDLFVGSINTAGAPLTLISAQSIFINAGSAINTSNGAGAGGSILMVAGANFEDATDPDHIGFDWILGGTAAGGNIFADTGVTINSNGSTSAGNIQMVAFAGLNTGVIDLGLAPVTAGGGTGANGDVSAAGAFININQIANAGGTANTGNVTLSTFSPTVVSTVVVNDSTGAVVSGSFGTGGVPTTPGAILVGSINAGNNVALSSSLDLVMRGQINSRATSGTALRDLAFDAAGSISSPGGITLVSGANMFLANFTAPPTNTSLTTSSTVAGDITIVAGAAFTENAGSITITGASGTGGFLDFSNFPLADLAAVSSAGAGGDITIAAYGQVAVETNSGFISSSGSAGQPNGNITIVGAETGIASIFIQNTELDASGGTAGTGAITLRSSTPSNATISKTTGSVTAGNFTSGALTNGDVTVDAVTAGSTVTAVAGRDINIGSDLTAGGAVVLNAGGAITANTIATTGNITATSGSFATFGAVTATSGAFNITAGNQLELFTTNVASLSATSTDDILLFGDVTAPGGIALVANLSIFLQNFNIDISTASNTGGGDIVMVAGAAFTQDASTITITGSGTGGSVDLKFARPLESIDTRSLAGNNAGGDITLVAFGGSVLTDVVTDIRTGGSGNGANGNFNVVAGGTTATTILIEGLVNTTGGTGGAGNVTLATTTPLTTPNVTIQRSNATYSNSFNNGTLQNATIVVSGPITTTAGNISMRAGADVTATATLTTASGAVGLSAGGFLSTAAVNAGTGSVVLTSGNNLTIGGNISARSGILIVSGHDIFPTAAGVSLSTSGAGTSGNISVIAGAAFNQDATTVTITGNSATGGQIDFDFNNLSAINTSSTSGGGNGGNVTLAAFNGTDASGRIFMDPTVGSITTGGNGAGTNGNVLAVAGSLTGTAMALQNINTTGGALNTGDIELRAATPDTTPSVVFQKSNALMSSGDFGDAPLARPSNITVGTLTVNNGADIFITGGDISATSLLGGANSVLTINSTGNVNVTNQVTLGTATISTSGDVSMSFNNAGGAVTITGNNISIGASTTGTVGLTGNTLVELLGAITATSFAATSLGDISLNADLTAPTGILLVAGHNVGADTDNDIDLSTASNTGNAGNITIIAGAAFLQDATTVTINGASATGGLIEFDANNLADINTRSTFTNGSGGSVTMVAFSGSEDTGWIFTDPTVSNIRTGGNGTGNNGNLTVVAGAASADGIGIRGIVNTTGGNVTTGNVFMTTATPDTTPAVVIQKSNAGITAGNFTTSGVPAASNIFVDNITVSSDADITLNSGGLVDALTLTGGANSILTINSATSTDLLSTNIGTVNITAGTDVTVAGAINQGAAGSLSITAGGFTQILQVTSGSARVSTGIDLFIGGPINLTTSFVGTAGGFLDIDNDITAPAGILLVAGHSIALNTGGIVDLSTASAVGNAGDITIVAGASFSENATSVTINGASGTGGNIDFDFLDLNSLNSRSTAVNGVGGDITMVAFEGSDAFSGSVLTSPTPTTVTTGGTGAGANGNFTAIGSSSTFFGAAIAGSIDTTGGAINTGDVYVASAIPVTTTPVVVQKAGANITAGDFRGGAVTAGDAFTGNITVANSADVILRAGGDITTGIVTGGALSTLTINSGGGTSITSSTVGTVSITAGNFVSAGSFNQGIGGTLNISAGNDLSVGLINSGTVRLSAVGLINLQSSSTASGSFAAVATNTINFANSITAPGGILLVSGRNINPTVSNLASLSTTTNGANAGDITLVAGAAFTQDANTVTITGASATGGTIDLDFFAVNTIDTRSTAVNGSGGDLTMVAFTGSDNTGGVFTDTAGSIFTGGSGAGANGNITFIGGDQAGFAVGARGTVTTTGGGAVGTGNVFLAAATPNTTPNVVLSKNTAAVTGGDFRGGALSTGDVFADNITVGTGASIDIQGNGFGAVLDLTGGIGSAARLSFGQSLDIEDVNVSGVSLLARTFIRLNGNVTAPGGILMVAGTDIFNQVANRTISASSVTGNAGDITLVAGAAYTQTAGTVTVTGASATGGRIDFDANNLSALTASSGGGNGAGGDITLLSLFGSGNTGEFFSDATTVINAGGNGSGSNGTITVVSAKNNGASGVFINGNINLTGGAPGTGAITLSTSALPGTIDISKSTGSIIAGTVLGGTLVNSAINSGNLTVRGGDITVRSGATVFLGALDVSGNVNGDGGSIVVSTAGNNSLTLGGTDVNKITSLNAQGGSTSGDGGTISATATGTGGITVASAINVSATEGDGGTVVLAASNGDLTFNTGAATINASGATLTATARQGGSITLTGRNIVAASNPILLTANGVSGGNGGQISVTANAGDINVGSAAGQFSASASGPGGIISLTANGTGGDVLVLATGSLSSSTINLTSALGVINLTGAVTGTTQVNLQVGGANTISGAGTVNGGVLTVSAGTGSTTLTTNVASLTLATNGNVSITETDDITLNTGSAGNGTLSVNSTGDDITVGGNVTANGGINLTTSGSGTVTGAGTLISAGQLALTAGTGNVIVNTNVLSLTANTTGSVTVTEANDIVLNAIAVDSLDITAGNGIGHGTGVIAADTINFSALGGDIGAAANFIQINNGGNAVDLTADATGDIYINIAGTGPLLLGTTTGDDITLTSSGPITTTGDVTATGVLDITTNFLTNENALTADVINIQSQAGSGLTIAGGTGGTMTAPNGINITATFGNLTFSGIQDFFGVTTLTAVAAPGASIIVLNGADIEGHSEVIVISNMLDEQGTGSLTGNPLTIQNDFFTLANSSGDVNLTSNIVFNGQSFAILASGNINITGSLTLIDLSDAANAGNLFLVAGYDFIPSTGGGTILSGQQFTLVPNNHSVSGGSINLGAASIDLSSLNGNGGNLTAIATTGNTNAGIVTLGDVDVTSVNAAGGNVRVIGEGGVSIGDVNTTGLTGTGTIELAVALPNVTGGNITVTDGVVAGGTFQATTLSAGNMVIGDLTASTITLRGAQGAGNSIAQSATDLTASTLNIFSGAGTVNLTSTSITNLNATGNGNVTVDNSLATTIGTLAGTLNLTVTSDAVITTTGAISAIAGLNLTGTAGAGLDAIVLAGPVTTTTTISLTAAGGADFVLNNRTLTSNNVTLASTAGDVNLTATGVINATGTATIDAFDSFAIAGTINAGSVALTSGDNIITSDITGTITAPNGTFLTSTNGGIGVDANNRFVTNSTSLLLNAGGGDIFVSSINTTGVDVTDVSASGRVDLIASGPITLHDVESGNGPIQIVQNGIGALTVAANATLTSTEGDIILTNLDLNKKTGKILIDDGATIKASGTTAGVGEVYITMGAIPLPPYADRKKPPKGVTINEIGGAGVFLGKKGIDTKKETNIALNALNRDLVFSLSGKLNKKAIHVGSNVTITADPPGDVVPLSASAAGRFSNSAMPLSAGLVSDGPSGLSATVSTGLSTALSPAGATLTTTNSSALQTDLSVKSTSAMLSEKSLSSADDALSMIFEDGNEEVGFGYIDAAIVSENLPNAIVPLHATSEQNGGNAKGVSNQSVALNHNMRDGSAVFAPSNNLTVTTPHANVAIAGGSVVLVVSGAHGTSVYDLHDSKKEAVKISFHNQSVALSPGRHAMVCATEKQSYAEANLAQSILHRGLASTRTARGGSVFTSEFAVNSAIECVPALSSLMASSHPSCAKLAAKLTKTQAVILYLSQSKEEFIQHVKAQVTAMR